MGARRKKLNFVSGSGPEPEVRFNDSDWQRLEGALCEEISSSAKSSLVILCHGLLFDLEACKNACDISEVSDSLAEYRPISEAIKACFLKNCQTDAEVLANELFYSELLKQNVFFDQYPIVELEGEQVEYAMGPTRPVSFRISRTALMSIGQAIEAAISAAESDVESRKSEERAFDPSETFGRFCSRVRLWAGHYSLPDSAHSSEKGQGRQASPFAMFLFELHKILSKQAGNVPRVNSPGAFEKWISRNPVDPTDAAFNHCLNMS